MWSQEKEQVQPCKKVTEEINRIPYQVIGFLKGRSPLLNLENSLKCQQYQDCEVAVKVASTLGKIEATRWMQEIEAIKRLGYNEYIVSMLGWCIYKNSYCLAFEMATSDLLTYV